MKKQVLFFMHLVQDLDLVFPLLKEIKNRVDCKTLVYVTDRLINTSPRVRKALESLSVNYKIVSYVLTFFGFWPPVNGFDVLVTAAESNARPHWAAHRLTERANRRGLRTYTLQHGFEQPGLTYFDETYTPENFHFASQKILIWGNPESLDPRVPGSIRRRCVPVGWPKAAPAPAGPRKEAFGKRLVLVSENLHRACYSDEFRSQFVECVQTMAKAFPDVTFIVKPHHNQRWLGAHHEGRFASFKNLILADARDPRWEPFTADALVGISDAVITTPSTVALDAAIAGSPVAVVESEGRNLDRYEPLSRLTHVTDWLRFIEKALDPGRREEEINKAKRFAERVVAKGDASKRILEIITAPCPNSF